jgi:aryl-alcohol dehydrogenase-like predicted oxidoreductase
MADFMTPAPSPPTPLGYHRVLSSTAGIKVSPLCLGGMSLGNAWNSFMGSTSKAQVFALLDAFYAAGGNFIDTSNNYQDEQSEAWIGEWMTSRGTRDNVVIATKFTWQYKSHLGGAGPRWNNATGNHRRSLHVSIRDSLSKLQTDWIDILYLHWWDYLSSIEEVMDSLHTLVQQGKVLYLGISDTPAWVVSACN